MSEPAVFEPTEGPPVQHERSDVNVKAVVTFVAVLIVALVAVDLVMRVFYHSTLDREEQAKRSKYPLATPSRGEAPLPPAPRLEGIGINAPEHDVGRLRPSSARIMTDEQDRVLLNGGAGSDKKGYVRRPIADVLTDLAGKLPVRPKPVADPRSLFLREPSVSSSGRVPRGGPEAKGDNR